MLKKLALVSAVALTAISLTACSSNSSDSSTKTTQSSKQSEKKPAKTISQDKELRTKFDKITVGDLMQKGQGGSTLTEVEKLFGSTPTSTTSSSEQGMKVKDETWNKGNVTITIQSIDNNVVSKSITGFKFTNRGHKLTLAAYNKLADNTSYESIVSKYGKPDSIDESLILGKKTVTATWLTGIKGDTDANVILTFENNKLTAKTQTDLK